MAAVADVERGVTGPLTFQLIIFSLYPRLRRVVAVQRTCSPRLADALQRRRLAQRQQHQLHLWLRPLVLGVGRRWRAAEVRPRRET